MKDEGMPKATKFIRTLRGSIIKALDGRGAFGESSACPPASLGLNASPRSIAKAVQGDLIKGVLAKNPQKQLYLTFKGRQQIDQMIFDHKHADRKDFFEMFTNPAPAKKVSTKKRAIAKKVSAKKKAKISNLAQLALNFGPPVTLPKIPTAKTGLIGDWVDIEAAIPNSRRGWSEGPVTITPEQVIDLAHFEALWADQKAYRARLKEVGGTFYVILHKAQRGTRSTQISILVERFKRSPNSTSPMYLCTKKEYGPNVKFPADGQQRLSALVIVGKPRRFTFSEYYRCSPIEMQAIFSFANSGCTPDSRDRFDVAEDMSPLWRLGQKDPSKIARIGRLRTKPSRFKMRPQVDRVEMHRSWAMSQIKGWEYYSKIIGVKNAPFRDANGLDSLRLWTSDTSIRIGAEGTAILDAISVAHRAGLRHHEGKLTRAFGPKTKTYKALGELIATHFNPTVALTAAKEAERARILAVVEEEDGNSKTAPDPIYQRGQTLAALLFLTRENGWDTVLRRIPSMVKNCPPGNLADAKASAKGYFDIIVHALNSTPMPSVPHVVTTNPQCDSVFTVKP